MRTFAVLLASVFLALFSTAVSELEIVGSYYSLKEQASSSSSLASSESTDYIDLITAIIIIAILSFLVAVAAIALVVLVVSTVFFKFSVVQKAWKDIFKFDGF